MPTLAAVDIGSNSVRLKISRLSGGRLVEIHEDRQVTRLGDSVFRNGFLSPEAIDDTVKALRTLPTVKSARITRALHWPPHLHLAIEEREPFVRVGGGDEWWVVDESGVPFRPAQKSPEDEKLFAITNPKFEPIAGKPLAKEEWEPAFQLASTLSAQKNAWPLRRIYFDKNGFASLRLQGGRHDEMLIRLGGDRWPEKLDRARLALEYFDRTNQRAKTLNLVSYIMPQWTPVRPVQAALDPSGTRATPGA